MKRFTAWLRAPEIVAPVLAFGLLLAGSPAAAGSVTGVDALSQLSATDLDTSRPLGRAFLHALFPQQATSCGKAEAAGLPFDTLCNWYSDPASEDPWPDLMVAMNGGRIVSAVTVDADRLNPATWSCAPAAEEGQATICYPRSIDRKTQESWSRDWQRYFDSVN